MGKPIVTLFSHLFKIQNSPSYINGYGMLSLMQHVWYFEACFESMENFDDHFYLITHLSDETNTKIYRMKPDPPSTCSDIIDKYLI